MNFPLAPSGLSMDDAAEINKRFLQNSRDHKSPTNPSRHIPVITHPPPTSLSAADVEDINQNFNKYSSYSLLKSYGERPLDSLQSVSGLSHTLLAHSYKN